MPRKKSSTAKAQPVAVPLSAVFRADNADVVIRAADALDFRVHKVILSLVSPFFKTMFTIPQPPTDTPGTLPHIDVSESAKTWEKILRTIYLMPIFVNNLDDLESLLLAATKYEMEFVINSHKKKIENRRFVQLEPLRLYALACTCGCDNQAKYVAKSAELLTVVRRSKGDDLNGVTVASYRRLITFLVERDNELDPLLEQGWMSLNSRCKCFQEYGWCYKKTREKLKTPYIQMEEVYSTALEERRRYHQKIGDPECAVTTSEINAFFGQMFRERERVCNNFMWNL
jgi:hypothetical protein